MSVKPASSRTAPEYKSLEGTGRSVNPQRNIDFVSAEPVRGVTFKTPPVIDSGEEFTPLNLDWLKTSRHGRSL